MRVIVAAEPDIFADVSARAKTCNCDAIVSQGKDGRILFVRNAPPPVERLILGKSAVIDAMTGPPALKLIHFENFDPDSVESLTRTQVLIGAKAESGASDRGIASLREIFSHDGVTSRPGAEVLIAREGREPELLKVIGDLDERVSLNERVTLRDSRVDEASTAEWKQTFGDNPDDDPTSSARLIVRFGRAGRQSSLGVSVDAAGNPGILPRLKLVVSQWLGLQPLGPVPISQAIVDLRTAIMTKLKPNQLKFYLSRNGGTIRAAHVDLPTNSQRSGS
jgi:hypothetical protein